MIIRKENKNDFDEIYTMTKIAFQTASHSDGSEQDFVNTLRNSSNYIPELALVAEEENKIIEHVMLTKFSVDNVKSLLLAPLTVTLEYRNQQVGTRLTKEVLNIAKELGYEVVFLVGHETYYPRFGFKPSIEYGIRNVNGIPDIHVMALELKSDALNNVNEEIDIS